MEYALKTQDARSPLPVVDPITESRGINHGQLDAEILLLQFCLDDLDFGGLVQLFGESVEDRLQESADETAREPVGWFTCACNS